MNWSGILSGLFLAYVLHSVWTVYNLYVMPPCSGGRCIPSFLKRNDRFDLLLFQSPWADAQHVDSMVPLDEWSAFDHASPHEKTLRVTPLRSVLQNGSAFVHVFLVPATEKARSVRDLLHNPYVARATGALTKHIVPETQAFNLLQSEGGAASHNLAADRLRPATHWQSRLKIDMVHDDVDLPASNVPGEIIRHLRLTPQRDYLPPLYVDAMSSRLADLVLVDGRTGAATLDLSIRYAPVSFGKLRLWSQLDAAMATMRSLGFTDKDVDEIKGIFTDTNFYLLSVTFVVAAVHLLFDFLAFKNDVAFWRKTTSMEGLSTRTVLWRCFSQWVVFFYLLDENTSLLVLVPTGLGAAIEVWKVFRALKMAVTWHKWRPRVSFGSLADGERTTERFDAEIMTYLSYLLYPLCAGGAVYSLLYVPHKSWVSWCVHSLANGVYAFGFLFMLPQLFVNYKLKSVAHLPWRAFTYKAFNTFIDDVFAFVITMPMVHRVACFRDDVVFLVYLYQRWLYPVDKSRVNEYGQSFDEAKTSKKKQQ